MKVEILKSPNSLIRENGLESSGLLPALALLYCMILGYPPLLSMPYFCASTFNHNFHICPSFQRTLRSNEMQKLTLPCLLLLKNFETLNKTKHKTQRFKIYSLKPNFKVELILVELHWGFTLVLQIIHLMILFISHSVYIFLKSEQSIVREILVTCKNYGYLQPKQSSASGTIWWTQASCSFSGLN